MKHHDGLDLIIQGEEDFFDKPDSIYDCAACGEVESRYTLASFSNSATIPIFHISP